MRTSQGLDGTPHITYYDKVHALSFVWDGTEGDWIDVAYGGYGEAVIARIPFTRINPYGPEMMMAVFKGACDSFINQIHEIECTNDHEHDAVGVLE
jgi:hypothetical protein